MIRHDEWRNALPKPTHCWQPTAKPCRSANRVENGRHNHAFGFKYPTGSCRNMMKDQQSEIRSRFLARRGGRSRRNIRNQRSVDIGYRGEGCRLRCGTSFGFGHDSNIYSGERSGYGQHPVPFRELHTSLENLDRPSQCHEPKSGKTAAEIDGGFVSTTPAWNHDCGGCYATCGAPRGASFGSNQE